VFVNCWDGEIGQPLEYGATNGLFKRLAKKTGKASPHLMRHSHATELIRLDGIWRPKAVRHANIQTTINTYVHLTDDDLQQEYQKYLQRREESNGN